MCLAQTQDIGIARIPTNPTYLVCKAKGIVVAINTKQPLASRAASAIMANQMAFLILVAAASSIVLRKITPVIVITPF